MKTLALASLLALTSCFATKDYAARPDVGLGSAPSMQLKDLSGKAHSLIDASTDLTVLFVYGIDCAVSRAQQPYFHQVMQKYKDKSIRFLMINPNQNETAEQMQKNKKEYGISAPILIDHTQTVAKSMKFERNGEIFLINNKNSRIEYRGPMNDAFNQVGNRKIRINYVGPAIASFFKHESIAQTQVAFSSCLINIQ